MKLRVGLVGVGNAWESRYRPALRALSDRFEVRAVCAEVAMQAEQAAREFGAVPVDGFRELAQRDDIDAMLMLTNQWYGSLPVLAACEAGKAIYCASTLEQDPKRLRQLRKRVERSGVAFMAELECRHAPATLRLKELIATRLGEPRMLFCHRREAADGAKSSRGAPVPRSAMQAMIELVDWCRYIVGREPTMVSGYMHHDPEDPERIDYQSLSLDFAPVDAPGSGVAAQVSCGRYVPKSWSEAVTFRPPAALQVVCENGIAFIDLPSKLIWFDQAGRHLESLESDRPVGEQMLSFFFRSVTSLVRQSSGLDDMYRSLDIALEAHRSHAEGRRIVLDPLDGNCDGDTSRSDD